jgi:hypothetical protein
MNNMFELTKLTKRSPSKPKTEFSSCVNIFERLTNLKLLVFLPLTFILECRLSDTVYRTLTLQILNSFA